jgi:hypothetical protein
MIWFLNSLYRALVNMTIESGEWFVRFAMVLLLLILVPRNIKLIMSIVEQIGKPKRDRADELHTLVPYYSMIMGRALQTNKQQKHAKLFIDVTVRITTCRYHVPLLSPLTS